MRRGGIATRTAEPFVASQTLDNAARVMDTAISENERQLISKAAYAWLFFFFSRILTRMHAKAAPSLPPRF